MHKNIKKWYHVKQNKTKPSPSTAKKIKIKFNNKTHQAKVNAVTPIYHSSPQVKKYLLVLQVLL